MKLNMEVTLGQLVAIIAKAGAKDLAASLVDGTWIIGARYANGLGPRSKSTDLGVALGNVVEELKTKGLAS